MAQNGKFIAPHTAHQIRRPRHLQQGLGPIAQRLIPGNMALLVIDGLEMVTSTLSRQMEGTFLAMKSE